MSPLRQLCTPRDLPRRPPQTRLGITGTQVGTTLLQHELFRSPPLCLPHFHLCHCYAMGALAGAPCLVPAQPEAHADFGRLSHTLLESFPSSCGLPFNVWHPVACRLIAAARSNSPEPGRHPFKPPGTKPGSRLAQQQSSRSKAQREPASKPKDLEDLEIIVRDPLRLGLSKDFAQSAAELKPPREFSFEELAAVTGGFADDRMIGQGGFGFVYHGRILRDDGSGEHQEVAIKKLDQEGLQGFNEWLVRFSPRLPFDPLGRGMHASAAGIRDCAVRVILQYVEWKRSTSVWCSRAAMQARAAVWPCISSSGSSSDVCSWLLRLLG